MTSKELLLKALNGEKTERVPVTAHWWGMYKFQLAGIANGYEEEGKAWALGGEELARVDSLFYETFKPDMFHLSVGKSRSNRDGAWWKHYTELMLEARKLESKAAIDEFVNYIHMSKEEVRTSGIYDHVEILSRKYGKDVFIALNEGNPVCGIWDPHGYLGFEEGLIALVENPDMLAYFMYKLYETYLPYMEVLYEKGAHGYIGSETYCSCDLISPQMYRDVVFPAQKLFYKTVDSIGLVPITYFLGDIHPILEDICKMGAKGLMIEESKKTFLLDAVEIHRKLDGAMTLFGNLDSVYTLLMGTPDEVRRETLRQLEGTGGDHFIMANGCPVAFDTPAENLHAMLDATRAYR
jgi:uroporphyrinogen-III decarboxylase